MLFKEYKDRYRAYISDKEVIKAYYDAKIQKVKGNVLSENIEKNLKDINNQNKELYNHLKQEGINDKTISEIYGVDKEYTKEEYIKNNNDILKRINKNKNKHLKAIDKDIYIKYVNDLFNSAILKYTFFTEIENFFLFDMQDSFLNSLQPVRNYESIEEYLKDNNPKELEKFTAFISEIQNKINERKRLDTIKWLDKYKKENDKNALLNYQQLPLNLEYNDRAYLVESKLINDISRVKNIDIQNIMLVNGLNYEFTSLNRNKKELDKELTSFDKLVLETIVYKFYYERGLKAFTDWQVATEIYTEFSKDTKTDNQIASIDASIEKLRHISITLDYKSIEKFENENINVSRDNYLISVERTKISRDKNNKKTITYEFTGRQFYLDYLYLEGVKPIEYNRALMYSNVKGLNKNSETQGLRRYLISRISNFNGLDMEISLQDIYIELGLIKGNYNDNVLRKERLKARNKTKEYLNELKKEYKFRYVENNKGKTIKGYIIKEI